MCGTAWKERRGSISKLAAGLLPSPAQGKVLGRQVREAEKPKPAILAEGGSLPTTPLSTLHLKGVAFPLDAEPPTWHPHPTSRQGCS